MIEHLFMLTCGWVGGVVSTLLIRHALDGHRPLDPALLPTAVAVPIAALPALPPAPQLSPYAPKPKRSWQAPKRERITRWVVDASRPPVAPPQPPPPPKPPAPVPPPIISRPTNEEAKIIERYWAPRWNTIEPEIELRRGGGQSVSLDAEKASSRPTTALLPSIAWGTPHGGEERTLTQEVRASAALSEHGAQAPRRRP